MESVILTFRTVLITNLELVAKNVPIQQFWSAIHVLTFKVFKKCWSHKMVKLNNSQFKPIWIKLLNWLISLKMVFWKEMVEIWSNFKWFNMIKFGDGFCFISLGFNLQVTKEWLLTKIWRHKLLQRLIFHLWETQMTFQQCFGEMLIIQLVSLQLLLIFIRHQQIIFKLLQKRPFCLKLHNFKL